MGYIMGYIMSIRTIMMVYIMRCLRIALDGLDHESMFLFAVKFGGWMPTGAKMSMILLQTPTGAAPMNFLAY